MVHLAGGTKAAGEAVLLNIPQTDHHHHILTTPHRIPKAKERRFEWNKLAGCLLILFPPNPLLRFLAVAFAVFIDFFVGCGCITGFLVFVLYQRDTNS